MNSKADVVRMWHEESYANPPSSIETATKKYISDDFQGLDKDGNVTSDKTALIAMSSLMVHAFEDFKGVVDDLREDDDGVIMTFHWEGTHTGDFDLSALGLGVIPASGKKFVTPKSETRFMVEGDQIVSSQPISGGFEYLLAALGVTMPSA